MKRWSELPKRAFVDAVVLLHVEPKPSPEAVAEWRDKWAGIRKLYESLPPEPQLPGRFF